jgi:hypothetical protein
MVSRVPIAINDILGHLDVCAGFGYGIAPYGPSGSFDEYMQPYRFHGDTSTDGTGGTRGNRSFYSTGPDQIVVIWFTNAEFADTKHIESITCEDLVFQKRAEKEGYTTGAVNEWSNTGGVLRLEVWWAKTNRAMNFPELTFRFRGGEDAFFLIAGISVFSDVRVPEAPWDTSPPDIIFSTVPTSNTDRTNFGHIADTYYYKCLPYEFISYGDALIGLDTNHPLLIDLTTFPHYLVVGELFFPTSISDGQWWLGLAGTYLIGLDYGVNGTGGGLNLVSWLSYKVGSPDPIPPGCVAPIPIEVPVPPITPAVITAWTLEPDWLNGVTERLLWKTDVLTSQTGYEQRRRLRNAPRRQIDAGFTLIGMDRRLYDSLMVGDPAAHNWHYPLWWEKYRLVAPAHTGGTGLAMDDLSYTEVTSGSVLMLRGTLPFVSEIVTVTGVAGGLVSLAAPLTRDWPKGSTVYLTKLCRMTGTQAGSRRADDAAQVTLTFDTIEPNEHPGLPPADMGLDYLVLDWTPNEADDLTTEYKRLMQEFDNQTTSVPIRRDLAGLSFMLQQFTYMVVGRKQLDELRGLLHFLQGKLLPLYVPTYFRDVELMPGFWAGPDDTILAVSRSGYTDFVNMVPQSRRMLLFTFRDGTSSVHTVLEAAVVSDGQESLTMAEPFYRPISNTLISRICWLALSRQDQDEIEILHHADGTGPATVTTTFATIEDGRDAQPYSLAVFNGSYEQVAGEPIPPPPDGPAPAAVVEQVPLTQGDVGGVGGAGGGTDGGGEGGDGGGGSEGGER